MGEKELPKSLDALIRESDVPVLVDFWAEWCGPCRMMGPVIEQISKDYKGRMLIVKVNVEEKQEVAAQYEITSIPTLMMFHKGDVLMRQSGALPVDLLIEEIEKYLSSL